MFLMECENRPIFVCAWTENIGEIHYFTYPFHWRDIRIEMAALAAKYENVTVGDCIRGQLDIMHLIAEYGGNT